MTTIRRIQIEFGEPFRKVVSDFAQMRYSKRCTALTLGITVSYFNVYLQRYAPDVKFPLRHELNDACIPRGKGWPKGLKGKNGMTKEAWKKRRGN